MSVLGDLRELDREMRAAAAVDPIAARELGRLTADELVRILEAAGITRRNHDAWLAAFVGPVRAAHEAICPLCLERAAAAR